MHLLKHAMIKRFNETIEYDITNEKLVRFKKKIIIQIIDQIRYPLILMIHTEHANIVDKV